MFPLPPPDRAPTPELEKSDPELVYTPRAMYSITGMIPAYITAPRPQNSMDDSNDFADAASSGSFASSGGASGIGNLSSVDDLSGLADLSVSGGNDLSAVTDPEPSTMSSSQEPRNPSIVNRPRGVAVTRIRSDSLEQISAQNPGLNPYITDSVASSRYPGKKLAINNFEMTLLTNFT